MMGMQNPYEVDQDRAARKAKKAKAKRRHMKDKPKFYIDGNARCGDPGAIKPIPPVDASLSPAEPGTRERGLVEAAREIIAARRDNNCALSDYMTRLDNAYDALERALAVAAPSQPGTDADAAPPYPNYGSMGGGSGSESRAQRRWEATYGPPPNEPGSRVEISPDGSLRRKTMTEQRDRKLADDSFIILLALEELRREEGASVIINCTNSEGTGPDNEAVEVCSDWTNWQPRRFEGQTLRLAMENAAHEKAMAVGAIPPVSPPPGTDADATPEAPR
jgi:hypothetical protein